MLKSGHYFIDSPFDASVNLIVRQASRRIVARWDNTKLKLTVPACTSLDELNGFLCKNADKLLEMRPEQLFTADTVVDCPEVVISIGKEFPGMRYRLQTVMLKSQNGDTRPRHCIHLKDSILQMLDHKETQDAVKKAVLSILNYYATRCLLPQAAEWAKEVNCHPKRFTVKYSKGYYGKCSHSGVISLNPKLLCAPDELRRFVVFHELAHLTHHNHSTEFHRLCNEYNGGREAELTKALRAFRFPF